MRKLKIAIDFDDTVANFTALWARSYAELFPERAALTHLSINRWALAEIGGLTQEELEETFRLVRARNYDLEMQPVDKNFEYWLSRIIKDGHEVYCLTANPEYVAPKIQRWFECYGVQNMKVVCSGRSKDKLNYEWDVIVDDSPDLIEHMKNDTSRDLIVYWALHNKSMNPLAKRTASNWEAVYKHVQEIAKDG